MEMIAVQSSYLAAVGFEQENEDDPKVGTVNITFRSGKTYSYSGVYREHFDALLSGTGKYFHSSFKRLYPDAVQVA